MLGGEECAAARGVERRGGGSGGSAAVAVVQQPGGTLAGGRGRGREGGEEGGEGGSGGSVAVVQQPGGTLLVSERGDVLSDVISSQRVCEAKEGDSYKKWDEGEAAGGVGKWSRSGEGGGREVVGRIELAKKEAKKGQRFGAPGAVAAILRTPPKNQTSADVSIRQHTSAYVSNTSGSAAPGAAAASLGTPKNQTDEGAVSNEGNQGTSV